MKASFILASILVLSSCSNKELFELPNDLDSEDTSDKMFHEMYNRHFLTDFLIKKDLDAPRSNTSEYFRVSQNAGAKTTVELQQSYPTAKSTLISMVSKDDPSLNHIVQNIGLRYLRNYLIPQNSDESVVESKAIFETIMKTSPIDLDVLTDTYVKISDILSEEEKSIYPQYLRDLYASQQAFVKEHFPTTKEKYLNAKDEKKKRGAIMFGKRLERLSKSGEYSNKKLKLVSKR